MVSQPINDFNPDYASSPGKMLEEILDSRAIKKTDFAQRCGLSPKHISQIIHDKASISPETAIQLERVLGISAAIWSNLDANYRLFNAKKEARAKLKWQANWTRKFPLSQLVEREIIPPIIDDADSVQKLLRFFSVATIDAWEDRFKRLSVVYRGSMSFQRSPESVAAWLRIGEIVAEGIETESYDKGKFIPALQMIRSLTKENPKKFEPLMREHCKQAGVALVFVSELPKTRLCGATRWLSSEKALIMLSLRYHWEDIFWFTFFHEASHILKHGKTDCFLDDENNEEKKSTEQEIEADRFAADFLIPPSEYKVFLQKGVFGKDSIKTFARHLGIAPGIVVGRLQHDKRIDHSWHNDLRRRFKIAS